MMLVGCGGNGVLYGGDAGYEDDLLTKTLDRE